MRHRVWSSLVSAGSLATILSACDTPAKVAEPSRLSATASVLDDARPASHPIELLDQCDPTTFNAAVGPGTCMSSHPGIKFSTFINQLITAGDAPAWRNAPSKLSAAVGTELVAINRGGEVHTFTKVAAFGGGVVPELNAVLGLQPVPECLSAPPEEFLPPGGKDAETVSQSGTALYQCCIHPWMKTVVTVR